MVSALDWDRAVQVRALVEVIVLCYRQDTLLSQFSKEDGELLWKPDKMALY